MGNDNEEAQYWKTGLVDQLIGCGGYPEKDREYPIYGLEETWIFKIHFALHEKEC
jgi:hypothetical protein